MSNISELSAAEVPAATPEFTADRRWVVAATMIGTTIEWYDFFIYGTGAALVFGRLFFPSFDPLVGKLAALATFSVGMFARPLGALIFGHFGDRIGRKSMLMLTMLLMGFPTVAIGLVPTYDMIGLWAAVILVVLRFLQGIALGGEWGGAVLMAVEHAPDGNRSLFGSLPQIGCPAGLLLATLVFAVMGKLPEEDFMNWGWRVPFLLSFLLIVAGIFVRNRIPESPEFARAAKSGKMVTIPAREVFNRYFKGFLLTVGLKLPEVTMFYLISVFMLSYGQQLGISKSIMLNSVVAAAAIECVTMYGFGLLGDRYGQKTVAAFGGIFIVFFAYPMFWLVQSGDPLHIFLAILGGLAVGHAVIFGAEPSLTAAQFPVEVRYSGISMGIQLSGAIGGGLAPVVATGLLAYTGTTAYVSLYVAGLGCVATACALMMRSERAPPL